MPPRKSFCSSISRRTNPLAPGILVTSSNKTQAAECDIKRSMNGIYHTPGSRYYNQTKSVAQ